MYQALYRKWRPLNFDDVIGQPHISQTLKHEVASNRIGHAFLFCGPRGTGKTSTARILSRAINCLDNKDGNPCNKCANCRGILDGSIMDIEEIDAASFNGIDDIRELRSRAVYAGATLSDKVYIIDEVHNLSQSAFNGLLKMLEEPPEHVRFVLATTEAHKVMATVASRCQRFDFRRISGEDIAARLRYVCEQEGIAIDDDAVSVIVTAADGAMRDALSLLETCLAGSNSVSGETARKMLGSAGSENVLELCERMAQTDAKGAMDVLERVYKAGYSFPKFFESLIRALRDIMVMNISCTPSSADFTGAELAHLAKIAEKYSQDKTVYAIKLFSDTLTSARYAALPRALFEAAVLRVCTLKGDNGYDSLAARVGELEKQIALGAARATAPNEPVVAPVTKIEQPKEEIALPMEKVQNNTQQSEIADTVIDKWADILSEVGDKCSMNAYIALQNASVRDDGGKIALVFPDKGGDAMRKMLEGELSGISEAIKSVTNLDAAVVLRYESDFNARPVEKAHDPFEDIASLPFVDLE